MTALEAQTGFVPRDPGRAGPRGFPLVGVLPYAWRDPLKFFVDVSQRYGEVIPLKLGFEQVFLLNNPRHIKHVLSDNHDNYRKSKFYDKLRPILGNGIFLSEKTTWRDQRRIAQPAFKGPAILDMGPEITDATEDMLERWRQRHEDGQPFDISMEMMRLTLDIVFRTFLNVKLGEEAETVFRALATVLRITERRVWSFGTLAERLPTPTNRTFRESLAILDRTVYRVLDERRNDPAHHGDLLSMLCAAYEGSDEDEGMRRVLRDQVMSIMLAGHETTGNALSWTWYLLSQNPEVEGRLRDEVDAALGDRVPTIDDLANLPYTKMVFQEAARLYPPVWTVSRTALGDDEVGGFVVPEGSTVMLCPYVVHRNPDLWEDPERFRPERFAAEETRERPYYAYFPFGGGPRVCIGKHFALLEGHLIMPMILQAYRLGLVPGHVVEPEPMITLRPRGGLPMTIERR